MRDGNSATKSANNAHTKSETHGTRAHEITPHRTKIESYAKRIDVIDISIPWQVAVTRLSFRGFAIVTLMQIFAEICVHARTRTSMTRDTVLTSAGGRLTAVTCAAPRAVPPPHLPAGLPAYPALPACLPICLPTSLREHPLQRTTMR